jgi:hypothetical protein
LQLSNTFAIPFQVQELLFEYATDGIAEALVEGFSRVKRCTNEGRALMSLDLQVLINGLQNLSPTKAKPNMQIVDNYIKVGNLSSQIFSS